MSKDVEKINLDSDLRRHLLLGTIGLVVAVQLFLSMLLMILLTILVSRLSLNI